MFFKTTRGVNPLVLKWYTEWQTSPVNSTINTSHVSNITTIDGATPRPTTIISRTHRPALNDVYTLRPEAKLGHGCNKAV
jgi:hypothetical protein